MTNTAGERELFEHLILQRRVPPGTCQGCNAASLERLCKHGRGGANQDNLARVLGELEQVIDAAVDQRCAGDNHQIAKRQEIGLLRHIHNPRRAYSTADSQTLIKNKDLGGEPGELFGNRRNIADHANRV